jgi:large subunit ribosomal protein L30
MSKIRVWQKKSVISEPEQFRRIVRGLGLRRMGKTREHKDNNCIRGMINKVRHLVGYELIQ